MSLQTFFDKFPLLADAPNGVAKLRQLILQLAVQGRLDTQNPKDESALSLLKKIKKEKEQQLQEKKSKQIELLPEISKADTLAIPIPTNWSWAWLGDLARFIDYRGKTPPKTASGVKLITAKNVRMGFVNEHPREFIAEKTYAEVMTRGFPKFGDILFTTEAPLGNVAQLLTHEKIALAQRVIDLQTFKPLFAEYLKVCLMSPLMQKSIIERATGMTATGIKASKLKLLPVPIPPLEEQKRIVARVGELMRLCDELESRQQASRVSRVRLNNVTLWPLNSEASLAPEEFDQACARLLDNFATLYDSAETVDKLRSTVLQLAVQGKLVRQDPNDEPATALLDRFGNEIENLREENSVTESGKDAGKSLPVGWASLRLGEVIKFIGGSQPPKNRFVYQSADGYTRLIQIRDYKSDAFKTYVPNEYASRPVARDDVMIGRYGPPVFQILRGLEGTYNVALMKAAPIESVLTKDYLFYLLQEPKLQSLVVGESERTAGQSGIRKELLHNYVAGLPPLEEQKRIVDKVNQLMALCDELETKLRQVEGDSEKLMNSAVQHVLTSINEASTGTLAGASA